MSNGEVFTNVLNVRLTRCEVGLSESERFSIDTYWRFAGDPDVITAARGLQASVTENPNCII